VELEAQRDQPLLGPVVQVELDPPALLIDGRGNPVARRFELSNRADEVVLQLCVVEREADRRSGRVHDVVGENGVVNPDGTVPGDQTRILCTPLL